LSGKIVDATLVQKVQEKEAEVRIDYVAGWACNFFGMADCMVPQISLGVVQLDKDGGFVVDIPDFSADPASSSSDLGAELEIVLREVKTWNSIALLQPQMKDLRLAGGALKLQPSYPDPTIFVARK